MIDVTKFVESLNGKPVAVMGLGISNLAAIKALRAAGADIAAWDDNEEKRHAAGVPTKDLAHEDMSAYGCLLLTPGIPLTHPAAQKARDAGIDVLCDLEILHRCAHGCKVVGITGTNGKSTTTALTHHVLKECGVPAVMGGNIGHAALDMTLPDANDAVIVLEISSYQADLCPSFAPDIAVLLNITPDHIDHHGSMENYAAAKAKMFRGAGAGVIGLDDEQCERIYARLEKDGARELVGISVDSLPEEIYNLDAPALPGAHNMQNAAAAFEVARLLGLETQAVLDAIKSFPGLLHRQYLVREIDGVSYINDSKATNAAATSKALGCYDDIYWIVGGRAKDGGLKGLEPYVSRIKKAFLIGEAADDFALWLKENDVAYENCAIMDNAVTAAHQSAQAAGQGTVLLSPACASFDQFNSFEQRGAVFTALVNSLKERAA